MNKIFNGALLAAALLATTNSFAANSVLDTGTPSGGIVGALSIDAVDWAAESFTLNTTTTIDSIKAFVQSTAADAGLGFTVALYGSTNVGGALVPNLDWFAENQGQLHQFTATYADGGWTGQSGLNWTLPAGTYFVAIETDGNGVQGLVLPTGVSTLPSALAYYSGGRGYDADPAIVADAFGLQVTAAVPEPASYAMLLLGLGAIACVSARRSRRG